MLNRKDVLGLRDMSREEIIEILDLAKVMKERINNPELRVNELEHTSVVTLFYENSTRTKTSFALAGKYLGATVQDLGISTSSVNKGESLIDTGKTIDQMGVDVMIMRNSLTGAPHVLARNVNAHVINAGDGSNEHPTQALLDLFTIRDYKKDFEGLKVAIIGDISHSRVARSNVFGLSKLGAEVMLAGPSTLLGGLSKLGVKATSNIKEAVKDADVVMGLRIQFERQKTISFPGIEEYRELFGINSEIIKHAKKDVLIMHPGPVNRGVEFSTDVVDSGNSVINIQVKNGVAVRMAILKLLANGGKS
ncbi:aspartate carbamoyltransferase catalytic subunit [Anaerotignum faecicola]|nr:aspartate carbamoyltransferase catalytic subunit [Anaerotignum faecicola]